MYFYYYYYWQNENNKVYLDFYFTKLKTLGEKKHFLNNFKDDQVIKSINEFVDLFNKYPFCDPAILEYTGTKSDVKLVTKWQKYYYLDILNEHSRLKPEENISNENYSHEILQIFKTLQFNSSFKLLSNLFDELNSDGEKNYLGKSILKEALSFYDFKASTPYKREGIKESVEKIKKYSEIINSGESLYDQIDSKEKEHIDKSVDFLLSRISNNSVK